jgi:plasmid replication initiation protein
MLRSWDECISTNISISDLQESLCAPASMRKNFGEFRRRVLDKAHKDIHKFTKLKYEWEPVKKGRKVVAVRFVMGKQSMKKAQDKARASSVKSSLRYDSQDRKRNNDQATSLLAAVQCAADGCPGRGSQPFCKACMEGK